MRLSRPRIALRLVLLLVGAAFMAWKAWETDLGSRADGLAPGAALLLHRLALVEGLLSVLALGTAVAAGLALRKRPARRRLGLVTGTPPAGERPPGDDRPSGPGEVR